MSPLIATSTPGGGVSSGPSAKVERRGMLLALDGRCLERLALPFAVQLSRGSAHRLEILIANPPKAATSLLGGFLMELERQGVDYRLTSTEKPLYDELVHYVHRFRHVSVILLDCLEHWDEAHNATLDSLRAEGYRVISLIDHREVGYFHSARHEAMREEQS